MNLRRDKERVSVSRAHTHTCDVGPSCATGASRMCDVDGERVLTKLDSADRVKSVSNTRCMNVIGSAPYTCVTHSGNVCRFAQEEKYNIASSCILANRFPRARIAAARCLIILSSLANC